MRVPYDVGQRPFLRFDAYQRDRAAAVPPAKRPGAGVSLAMIRAAIARILNEGDLDIPAVYSGLILATVWAPVVMFIHPWRYVPGLAAVHTVLPDWLLALVLGLVGAGQLGAVILARCGHGCRARAWSCLGALSVWAFLAAALAYSPLFLPFGAEHVYLVLATANAFRRFLIHTF